MNRWFRIVVLAKGPDLKVPGITAALHNYAGGGVSTYHEDGGPAFEFTTDDSLQDHDEHDIVRAVWEGNGAPCDVTIREHYVTEADPCEKVYTKESVLP